MTRRGFFGALLAAPFALSRRAPKFAATVIHLRGGTITYTLARLPPWQRQMVWVRCR